MHTIEWWCRIGDAIHKGKLKIPNDSTEEEISDYVYEEVISNLSWGWNEVNDENEGE